MVGKLRILLIKKYESMMNEKIKIFMDTVVPSRERERGVWDDSEKRRVNARDEMPLRSDATKPATKP